MTFLRGIFFSYSYVSNYVLALRLLFLLLSDRAKVSLLTEEAFERPVALSFLSGSGVPGGFKGMLKSGSSTVAASIESCSFNFYESKGAKSLFYCVNAEPLIPGEGEQLCSELPPFLSTSSDCFSSYILTN